MGNVVSEDQLGFVLPEVDVLRGACEVAVFKPLQALSIVLGEAAGVGSVPGLVFEVESHLGDLVTIAQEKSSNRVVFFRGIAFAQEWITKPSPSSL